jgi:hypothetical protein
VPLTAGGDGGWGRRSIVANRNAKGHDVKSEALDGVRVRGGASAMTSG